MFDRYVLYGLRAAMAALALQSAGLAAAQDKPRSYAVISEMAREVSVTAYREATGSRLDNNQRTRIPIPEGALDRIALLTAQQALRQAEPGGRPFVLAPADSDFFDGLQAVSPGDAVRLPADLADALGQQGSTHVLVFTRHRSDAQFRGKHTSFGSGKVEGMGFYVDQQTPTYDTETGEAGIGFLASHAYFRGTLIDVATARVVRTEVALASEARSAGTAKGSPNPWNTMTTAQKMSKLGQFVKTEVERIVPLLVARP